MHEEEQDEEQDEDGHAGHKSGVDSNKGVDWQLRGA